MQLFKIILFEYILGYVLQGFAIVAGIFAFNQKKINTSVYFLTSIIFIIISYAMRQLPISYGVHTILDMICLFILSILYLKINALKTIKSLLLITIILIITELLNVFAMTSILGTEQFNLYMSTTPERSIVGLPAALLFALIMVFAYLINFKKSKKA